jgi:acyl-CoA thioesterase-1
VIALPSRLLQAVLVVAVLATGAPAASILCLGDSLTAGYGLEEAQAWPALVEASAKAAGRDWTLINAGISGDTTAGGLRRLKWALRAKPDLVVVALGGNDGLRGVDPATTRDNLAAIVDRVRAAGAAIALAGMRLPTNFGRERSDAFAAVFAEVARDKDVPLLPFLLEGVGGVPELNQADGIHPNAEGQRRVAETMHAFLAGLLATPAPAP